MKTHPILRNLLKKIGSSLMILFTSFLSFSPLSFSSHQRPKLSCQEIMLPRYQVYQRQENKKEEKIKALNKQTNQILRHPGLIPPGSKTVSFGELDVNLEFKVAKRNFVKLELTSLEFLILVLLIHSSNQHMTAQEMRERLSLTHSLRSINRSLSSLSQKIGVRNPISTSSYSLQNARASVYLSFEKQNKSQSLVKINKIPLEFKITSIDTKNRSVFVKEKENHLQVTQEKQISLGSHFDLLLFLLDLFQYAGETLSLKQISQRYTEKSHFNDITETSLNNLSKKIPGFLFVNRHLYTLNPYVLDERIMKEYQIAKEPKDLQEISGLKISLPSPLPAIYYEGYKHHLIPMQFQALLPLLESPEEFFPIQYVKDQINDSPSFSDASKSEKEISVQTTLKVMKNLLDTLTPLGIDLRLRNKEKNTKKLDKSDEFGDEFGFFGLKKPNSFLALRDSLSLNRNSKILTIDGVRSLFWQQKKVDALFQLITHLGSIVIVSQFSSSPFDDLKAWPLLNLQEEKNQFGYFNKIFGEAFIPISIFIKDQWFMFGYKLVYSWEPEWEDYFISNMDFLIQLDPVFQKIKIDKREFSLPYLNFKVLHIILNAFQRAPYLEERNKSFSEMELAFQVLFWLLMHEEKISSHHPYYPLDISETFSVLKDLFPELHKALKDDIKRDFPELEKHLNSINSHQMDVRSSPIQFTGLKKRISILQLYREGKSFLEISKRLEIKRHTVSKIKRDFDQFSEGWKKMIEVH